MRALYIEVTGTINQSFVSTCRRALGVRQSFADGFFGD